MFKEKFNEEMQKIKPSSLSKAQLLEKINNEQQKADVIPFKRRQKKGWIAVLAAAVAICIVSVTAFNLPIWNGESYINTPMGDEEIKFPTIEHENGIPANVSYSQVYQLLSAIYKSHQNEYIAYTMGTDDWVEEDGLEGIVEEYEETIEEYDGEMPGGMGGDLGSVKGENATAKPSDSVDVNENAPEGSSEDFSTTNTQVADVDEADIIKTDGKYIYSLNVRELKINIAKAEKGKLTDVSTISLSDNTKANQKYFYGSEMYVTNGRLVILYQHYADKNYSLAKIYDISNPEKPELFREVAQSGSYLSSRVIGNKLYYFTNEYIYAKPNENDKCSYVPCAAILGERLQPIDEEDIYIFDGEISRSYLTAISVDLETGNIVDTKTALGGGNQLYANTKSFYVTAEKSNFSYAAKAGVPELATKYEHASRIMRFAINDGKITAVAEGTVEGTPLNQFSMDEHNGYFRIVTTVTTAYDTKNAVYVLDSQLKIVGKTTDIAKGERVYSVRFMGDTGYFVTFRQVDPLFAVDLSNPKEPKILSALKIPGFSNYMHPWGDGMMLGIGADADEKTGAVKGIKLSMFDISDPKNVTEKDKEILNILGSDVGVEHKAILANFNKNLIGFAANDGNYYLYSYAKDKGFTKKAALKIPRNEDAEIYYSYYFYAQNTRGIYIGDYFYLCGPNGINSYSLLNFKEIDSLIY